MKVAIVADWLPVFAGAEHVIEQFQQLWPNAPLYTTIAKHDALGPLRSADIRTSRLQKWFTVTGNHRWMLPWMQREIENFDLRGYDVIVSSSHAIGKGIIPPSTARHICYCHTPMRYAWEMEEEYLQDFRIPKWMWHLIKEKMKSIRRWDLETAKRVDAFVANSKTVQERIANIYNRDSVVIHPPVSEKYFESGKWKVESGKYFLTVSRLVPYKRIDLLIEAANTLKFPLKVAGSGPELERLKALAGDTVEMLGFVPEEDLPGLYSNAEAFLFAPFEDAGVVPLEAQACGTPVIAFGKGGALDTVKEGETGVFFKQQSVDAFKDAFTRFETMQFDANIVREHARQFSAEKFREKMLEVL